MSVTEISVLNNTSLIFSRFKRPYAIRQTLLFFDAEQTDQRTGHFLLVSGKGLKKGTLGDNLKTDVEASNITIVASLVCRR